MAPYAAPSRRLAAGSWQLAAQTSQSADPLIPHTASQLSDDAAVLAAGAGGRQAVRAVRTGDLAARCRARGAGPGVVAAVAEALVERRRVSVEGDHSQSRAESRRHCWPAWRRASAGELGTDVVADRGKGCPQL